MPVHNERIRILKEGPEKKGPVLYWMSRDQRAADNWALLHAQHCAIERRVPLLVCFCLVPDFLHGAERHYRFMLEGLKETAAALRGKHIPFLLLKGSPEITLPALIRKYRAGLLVTDFDPLRIKRQWKAAVCERVGIAVHEVDAHNIVPCRTASPKQEYAAYTIRPKLRRLLPEFLQDFPTLASHPFRLPGGYAEPDWVKLLERLSGAAGGDALTVKPGSRAGMRLLRDFGKRGLTVYGSRRNDPVQDGQSNLSPYFHFGQLSAQRAALEIGAGSGAVAAKEAFLEELIIRRELADNFCFYNERYDSVEGFPAWAQETLRRHRKDRRPHLYTLEEFEGARTDDGLWNAAETQMVRTGKMHGYMRMYWAKKILEWTESPEQAMEFALYLNDRYELDGRDPNGYAGIAWSIGGVHDRAWGERSIFGKIRYMSYQGCRGKFDVAAYMRRWS